MAGRVFKDGRWWKVKKTLIGYRGGQEIWDTEYLRDDNQSDNAKSTDRTGNYFDRLGEHGTRTISELYEAKRRGEGRPVPYAPSRDQVINGTMLAQRKHIHALVRRAYPAPENIHRMGFQSANQSYSEAAINFAAGGNLPASNFVKNPPGGWHQSSPTSNPRIVQAGNTSGVTRATIRSIAENLLARHAAMLEAQYRNDFTAQKREALSAGGPNVKEKILAIQAQEANVISILADVIKSGTTRTMVAQKVSGQLMTRPQSEWTNIATRSVRNLVDSTINPIVGVAAKPYESQEDREHRNWRNAVSRQNEINRQNPVQYGAPIAGLTPKPSTLAASHRTGTRPSFEVPQYQGPGIRTLGGFQHPDDPRGTTINDYIGSGKYVPAPRPTEVVKSRTHSNPAQSLKEAREHWTQIFNRSTSDIDRRKATEVLNAVDEFEKAYNAKGNRGIAQINLPRAKQNKVDAVGLAEKDLQWILDAENISAGRSTWDQASHSHDPQVKKVFKQTGLGTTIVNEDPTVVKQRQDAIDTFLRRKIDIDGSRGKVSVRDFFARQQSVYLAKNQREDYMGAKYSDTRRDLLTKFLLTDPHGKQIAARFSSVDEAVGALRTAVGYRAQMQGFFNEPEARDIKGQGGKPAGFEAKVKQSPSGTAFIDPTNLTVKDAFGKINGPTIKELQKLGVKPDDKVHKLITQLSYVGRGRSGTLSTERGMEDILPNVINHVNNLYGHGGVFSRNEDDDGVFDRGEGIDMGFSTGYVGDNDLSAFDEGDSDFAQMTSNWFGQTGALSRNEAEYQKKRSFTFNQTLHRRMTISEPRVKAAQFTKLWQTIAGVGKAEGTSPEFNKDVAHYERLARISELEILRGASFGAENVGVQYSNRLDQFLGTNSGAYDLFGGAQGSWGETGFFTSKVDRDFEEDIRRFNEMENGIGDRLSREDAMTLFKSAGADPHIARSINEHGIETNPNNRKRRRDLPEAPYGALHPAARGVTTALGLYNSLVRNTNERLGLSVGGDVPSYEASINKALAAGDTEAAAILENLSMQKTGENPNDPIWMGKGLSSGAKSPFTHYLPFNPLFAAFRDDIESGGWTQGKASIGLNPSKRLLGSEGFTYMSDVLRDTLDGFQTQSMQSSEFNMLFLNKLGAKRNEHGHIELKDGTTIEKGTKLDSKIMEDLFHKAFSGELQDWGTNAGYKMVDEFDNMGAFRPVNIDRNEMTTKGLATKLVSSGVVNRALNGMLRVPYTQGPGDAVFGETYMSDYHPGDKLLRPLERATEHLFASAGRQGRGHDELVPWKFFGVSKYQGEHRNQKSEIGEAYGNAILDIRSDFGLWSKGDEERLAQDRTYNNKRKAEEIQYRLARFSDTASGARSWFARGQGSAIRQGSDDPTPGLLLEADLFEEDKWQVLAAQQEHRMAEYSHGTISEAAPRLASYFAGDDAPMREAIMHSAGIHGPPIPRTQQSGQNHLEFAAVLNAAFEAVAGNQFVRKQVQKGGNYVYKEGSPVWEQESVWDPKERRKVLQDKFYRMSQIDESMDEFRSRTSQEITHALALPKGVSPDFSGITMTRAMILGESTKNARDNKNATRGIGLYGIETVEDTAKFQNLYAELLRDYRKSARLGGALQFNKNTLKEVSELMGWNYDETIWKGGNDPEGNARGMRYGSSSMARSFLDRIQGNNVPVLGDLNIDTFTKEAIGGNITHPHIGDIGTKSKLAQIFQVNAENVRGFSQKELKGMYNDYFNADSPDSALGRLLRAQGTLSDGKTLNVADSVLGTGGVLNKLTRAQGNSLNTPGRKSLRERLKERWDSQESGHAMAGLASIGGLGLTIGATAIAAKLGFDPMGLGDMWDSFREGWGGIQDVLGGGTVSALMGASAKWRDGKGRFIKAPETMLDLYGDEQGSYTNPIRINPGDINDSPNYEDRMFGYIEQLKNKSNARQLQLGPKGLRDEKGRFRQLTLDDFATGGTYTNLLADSNKDNFMKDLLGQGGPLALGTGRLPRPALVTPDIIPLGSGGRSMRASRPVNRVKRTPAQPPIVGSAGRGSQGMPPPPGSPRNFSDPYEFHPDHPDTVSPTDMMMQGLIQFSHKNKEPLFNVNPGTFEMMGESDYARAHAIGKKLGVQWTDAQAQAIGMPSMRGAAPSVITGNPGSGKTQVEIARVLMRLGEQGMTPEVAPILTSFANATTKVTEDRLKQMVKDGLMDEDTFKRYIKGGGIKTIHSLGLDLMSENRLKMTNVFGASGQIGKDVNGRALYGEGGSDIYVKDEDGNRISNDGLETTKYGKKYLEKVNGELRIKKGIEFTKFEQAGKSQQIETFREATHEFWTDQMHASGYQADATDVMRYASGAMPFEYSAQGMQVRRGIRDDVYDRDRPFVALKAEMKDSSEERLWKNVQILAETGIKPHQLIDFFDPAQGNMNGIEGLEKFQNKQGEMWLASQVYKKIDEIQQRGSLTTHTDKLGNQSVELIRHYMPWDMVNKPLQYIQDHMHTDLATGRDSMEPEIANALRDFIDREYIVSEAQDANLGQLSLLKVLSGGRMTMSGDPKQDLYPWRGGSRRWLKLAAQSAKEHGSYVHLADTHRFTGGTAGFLNELYDKLLFKDKQGVLQKLMPEAPLKAVGSKAGVKAGTIAVNIDPYGKYGESGGQDWEHEVMAQQVRHMIGLGISEQGVGLDGTPFELNRAQSVAINEAVAQSGARPDMADPGDFMVTARSNEDVAKLVKKYQERGIKVMARFAEEKVDEWKELSRVAADFRTDELQNVIEQGSFEKFSQNPKVQEIMSLMRGGGSAIGRYADINDRHGGLSNMLQDIVQAREFLSLPYNGIDPNVGEDEKVNMDDYALIATTYGAKGDERKFVQVPNVLERMFSIKDASSPVEAHENFVELHTAMTRGAQAFLYGRNSSYNEERQHRGANNAMSAIFSAAQEYSENGSISDIIVGGKPEVRRHSNSEFAEAISRKKGKRNRYDSFHYGSFSEGGIAHHEQYDKIVVGELGPEIVINKEGGARKFSEPAVLDVKQYGGILKVLNANDTRKAELAGLHGHKMSSAAGGVGKGFGSLTPFADTGYGEDHAKELTNFLREAIKVEADLLHDKGKGWVVKTNAAGNAEADLIKTAIMSWENEKSRFITDSTNKSVVARGSAVDPTHSAFEGLQMGKLSEGSGSTSMSYGGTIEQLEKMSGPLEGAADKIAKFAIHIGDAGDAVKHFAKQFGTDSQGLINKNKGTSSHRIGSTEFVNGQPAETHENVLKDLTGSTVQVPPMYGTDGQPLVHRGAAGWQPLAPGEHAPQGYKDFINTPGGGGRGFDTGGLGEGFLGKMHGVAANMNTFAWAFQPVSQGMQERGQRAMQAQQAALAYSEDRNATILMTGGTTKGLGMGADDTQRDSVRGVYDSLYGRSVAGVWDNLTTPNITSGSQGMLDQFGNVIAATGGLIQEGASRITGQGTHEVSRRQMSRYDYWQSLGVDQDTYIKNTGLAASAMGVQVDSAAIAAYGDTGKLFDNLTKALVKAEETYGKGSQQYLEATQNLIAAGQQNPLAAQGYSQTQDLIAAGDVGNKLAKWGSLYGMDPTTSMSPIRIAQMAGYSNETLNAQGGADKVMGIADILNKAANMAGIDPAAMMGVFKYSGSATLPTMYAGEGSYLADTRGDAGTAEERKTAYIASQSVNALRKGQEPEQVGRAYRTVNAMINDPQGKQSFLMARAMGIMQDDFTLTGQYKDGTFNKETGEFSGQLRTGDPAVLKRVIEEVQSEQEIKTAGLSIRQQQLALYGNNQTKSEFALTTEKLNIQAQSVALEGKMIRESAPFQKAQLAGSIALSAMQSSESIRSAGFNASSRIQGMEDSVFYGQQSQQRNELAREQRSIAATRGYEDMLYGAPGQDRSYRSYYSAQANAAAQNQGSQNIGQYNQTVVNAVGLEAAQTYRGLDYQRQMVTLGQSQMNSGAAYAAQMKYIEDQKQFAEIKFEGDSQLRGTQRDIQDEGLKEQIDLLPVIQELERARHEEGQRQARAAYDIAVQQGVVTDANNALSQIELDHYDEKLKIQLDSNQASQDEIAYQKESLALQKEGAELQLENAQAMLEYSKELKDVLAYSDLGGGIGGNRTDITGIDPVTGWIDVAAGNDAIAKSVQADYDFYYNKVKDKDWSDADKDAYAKAASGQTLTGGADIDNVAAGVLVEGATLTQEDIRKQWAQLITDSKGSIEGTLVGITQDEAAAIINTANAAGVNADINAGLNTPESVQSFAASVGIFQASVDKLATQSGANSVIGAGSGLLSGLLGGANIWMTVKMLSKLGAGGGAAAAGAAGTGAATAAAGGGEAAAGVAGSAGAGAAVSIAAAAAGALMGNELARWFQNRKGTKEGRFITGSGGDMYDENGNLMPDVAQYYKDNPIVDTHYPVYGPEEPKGLGYGPWSGAKRDFTYFTGTSDQAEVLNIKTLPSVGTGDTAKEVDGWWGNVKEDVGNFFGSIGTSIKGTTDMVKSKGDDVFNGAFNFFYSIDEKLSAAKNWVMENGEGVVNSVSSMFSAAQYGFVYATEWATNAAGNVAQWISDLFNASQYGFSYATEWATNAAGNVAQWISDLFNAVRDVIGGMIRKLPVVGNDMADAMGFADGKAAGGYSRGGLIRVGEQGPEMILSQRGDFVMPASQTMQMMKDWSPSRDMQTGHSRSLSDESMSGSYGQRVFGLDPVTARNMSESSRGGNSIEINVTVESGAVIDPMMIDKLKTDVAREVRKAIED